MINTKEIETSSTIVYNEKEACGNINSPLQCRFGTMKMAIKTTKDLHLYPIVDQ